MATMAEQRCQCGHVSSIHRLDRATGTRVECWSVEGRTQTRPGCPCLRFEATGDDGSTAGD